MAIPSGVLLVISLLAGSAVAGVGDSDTSGLIDSAVSVARGTMVLVTGITFIVAIAVIIVTLVARRPAEAEELPAPTPDEAQPDSPPPAVSGSAAPPSVTPPDPS
jgi:heme/copper-type cytochrome/quinol oxidase subunit 2